MVQPKKNPKSKRTTAKRVQPAKHTKADQEKKTRVHRVKPKGK